MAILEVLTYDGLLYGPPEQQAMVGALIAEALHRCNGPRDRMCAIESNASRPDWNVRPFYADDADEDLAVVAADATRWVLDRWGTNGVRSAVEWSVPLRRERPDHVGEGGDRFRRPRSGYSGSRVAVPN